MIMPSQGLVSLQRAVTLLLSPTHHFHSLSKVKTKPYHGTDDSDVVFFRMRLDSMTLTDPGLVVLIAYERMYALLEYVKLLCMQLQHEQ